MAAVSFLFSEAAKLRSTESDLRDSLAALSLEESLSSLLLSVFFSLSSSLRSRLECLSVRPLRYDALSWRCDVVLASRTLRNSARPEWIFDLTLAGEGGEKKNLTLQTDATNLA